MAGKILFLMPIAAGMLAAQDALPKPPEPEKKPDVTVTAAPARKCSIPLINIRPANIPRMPMIRPRNEFAPKRFFIEPPAPPCEDPQPNPLISKDVERKGRSQAK